MFVEGRWRRADDGIYFVHGGWRTIDPERWRRGKQQHNRQFVVETLHRRFKRVRRLPPDSRAAAYGAAVINWSTVATIVRVAGIRRIRDRRAFRSGLEHVLTQYVTDIANQDLQLKPNELVADLKAIADRADELAALLSTRREAQDAMVRATEPHRFVAGAPSIAPTAAPIYGGMAVEIMLAARSAIDIINSERGLDALSSEEGPPLKKPYVREGRDKSAVNQMIRSLIAVWQESISERPHFVGGERPSAFIRLLLLLLERVGAKIQSADALAKRCQRLVA